MRSFKGKKILVTGASGLIGSNLVGALLSEGAYVVALGRSEKKLKDAFCSYIDNESFSICAGNVSESIPDRIGMVDFIFHAASPISGNDFQANPVDTIKSNINGTINCFDHLIKMGGGG